MYYGCNRYLCEVLDEMRALTKSMNFSMLSSLIEEVQVMGNRMEAGLSDISDFEKLHDDITREKKELKDLQKEIKKLQEKKELLQ